MADPLKKTEDVLKNLYKQLDKIPDTSKSFEDVFNRFASTKSIFSDLKKTTDDLAKSQMTSIGKQIEHYKKLQQDAKETYNQLTKMQKKLLNERLDMLKKEEKHLKAISKLPDDIAKHFEQAKTKIGKAIGTLGVASQVAGSVGLDIPGMTVAIETLKGAQAGGWQGALGGAAWGADVTLKELADVHWVPYGGPLP